MHLVVGLGNPGPRYRETRHNVGFQVVERLAERAGGGAERVAPDRWALETTLGGRAVVLMKPLLFMNRSGGPVLAALEEWQIGPERLLVAVDDVALPTGRIRLRARGSHGGHNGLRSIEEALGTRDYARLRLGVGSGAEVGEEADLADFVLSKFPTEDILIVRRAVERAAEAAVAVLQDGLDAAMNRYNREEVADPAPGGAGPATP